VLSHRVVGINVRPEAQFFNLVPPAFLKLGVEHYTIWRPRSPLMGQTTGQNTLNYAWLGLGSDNRFLAIMALLAILVLAVPMIAGLGCISLSIYRLVALSKHHDNSNVRPALILLYSLVLLQGGLFVIWLMLRLSRFHLANRVSLKYGFEAKSNLIDKYMDKTLRTAIKNGVSSTINRNLVSFAVDLIKSDYTQDHIDAVLVMHTLTSQNDHRERTLSQIQSSELCVSRLLDMVTSKSRTDQRTKICIAEIVAHLASNLRLADIPGATQSISSMISPYFTKISTPATNNIERQTTIDIPIDEQGTIQSASATNGAENVGLCISVKQLMEKGLDQLKKLGEAIIRNIQQGTLQPPSNTSGADIRNDQQGILQSSRTTSGAETKPLIIHGLLILAKLAVNPDNCKQIYDSKGLFSKIISPVKNKVYEMPNDYGITMEITEKALEVVSMLVSGTDETNGKIRRDIGSKRIAVNDIRPIFERDQTYNKLKIPVTKILTELYSDMSSEATTGLDDITQFIKVLMNIFFDAVNESGLRKAAGKALAGLAMENANCTTAMNLGTGTETSVAQQLTVMIPEANNRLYRTAVAQLLMQFIANPDPKAQRKGLESVKTILHEVRVNINVHLMFRIIIY
jgi:hypothetical protein